MSLRPVRTVCGLILLSHLAACGDAKLSIPKPHQDNHSVNAGDGDVTKGDGDSTSGDGDSTIGDGDSTVGDGDNTGDGDAIGADAGPVDVDAGPGVSNDAGVDAGPTPDDGGPGSDGGPRDDAGPGGDAGPRDAGPPGDGGPGNDAGPDAGPGDASDAGPAPSSLRIDSPATYFSKDTAPKCTADNFGLLEHDTMISGVDDKIYQVGILRICSRTTWDFNPTDYQVGPSGAGEFFGTPVRTSWGGVVNFFEHGLYKDSLGVTLLEGDDHFLSISCKYGRGRAQQQLSVSRTDAPATIHCPWTSDDDATGAWKAYGSLDITVDHDELHAVFHPQDGSLDVPVMLFAM